MIIHKMQQGTPEWHAVKCGKVSASNISAVLAKGRGNAESKTRKTYLMRLLAERISGLPQDTYMNGAMQWGIDTEPQARAAYEFETLNAVEQVGFVEINEFLGCSPDGLIDADGGVEIKCPNTTTHLQYLLDNTMPAEYVCQVQSTLWMTDRQWWDFVSFDPRIKPDGGKNLCLWSIRVERDEKKIGEIKDGVNKFIDDMLELEQKLKGE